MEKAFPPMVMISAVFRPHLGISLDAKLPHATNKAAA
jgi:hypothetical protein